jgi:hypothetical protein
MGIAYSRAPACGKMRPLCAHTEGRANRVSGPEAVLVTSGRAARSVKKRDNLKLNRYLHRNRVEPLPAPLSLEYSSLPPPRRALWRMTIEFVFAVGTRLVIALAGLGVAIAIGLWQEPTALAGILLVVFSILSLMVLIAMLRR